MFQRAMMILAAAFFLTVAFQTFELVREHANIERALDGQQTPLEQALRVRQETEQMAGDTAALADKGDANAKLVVDEMRRQGVALREPPVQPTPAPSK